MRLRGVVCAGRAEIKPATTVGSSRNRYKNSISDYLRNSEAGNLLSKKLDPE
jgi:hypothetical protein